MSRLATSVTVIAFLLFAALLGCSKAPAPAPIAKEEPQENFLLLLAHFQPSVVFFQDFMITHGPQPERSDRHIRVQVSAEQVRDILSALAKCQAMTRQDGPPPGRPLTGWRLEVYQTLGGERKVQGYWHLGPEADINTPGRNRDILKAIHEALVGDSREQMDRHFADVARRAPDVTKAAQAARTPVEDFVIHSHWVHSRVVLTLTGKDSGLEVVWRLPAEVSGRFQEDIIPGNPGPLLRLYRGPDIARYLAPSSPLKKSI